MAHELLERAARLIEQARALKEEFPDLTKMPAEVQRQMDALLAEASKCRHAVERESHLADIDSFLREPDYKDGDKRYESRGADDFRGVYVTDEQRAQAAQKAFFQYVRKGASGIDMELKAQLVEDTTGELLVPVDFAGTILRELPREAVLRPLMNIRPTTSNKVDIGVVIIDQAGWGKLETGTVAQDGMGSPPADKDTITVHDLNALVKIGVDELDDADDDLASIIRQALSLKIAEQEDDAFANGGGDPANRPFGIAQATEITQGVTASAGETVDAVELKSVMFKVPAQFRRNGVWLGHTSAEEKIALLQDGDGRFLWQPATAQGEPATLFGKRWYTVDGLPDISATSDTSASPGSDKSVFFADLRAGYMVADRRRLTVTRLEERFAEEGKVGLLFRHRVGGDVIRPKAFAFYRL